MKAYSKLIRVYLLFYIILNFKLMGNVFCIDERYADAIYRPNVHTPTISKQTLLVHNLPHKSHKSSEEVDFVILYHSFTYHSILALPPVCKTNICLKCHIRHLFTAHSIV